ncbi:TonB-dependent receptor plug domain-containing protein [Paraglaciecola hydrolytica]|uniref:TonB-dependent receptor n=1 Tax=Paraglaciecola hydrolytica TaxID=1799789 RepID=A0A135ZZL2_9ALTE|nr:TonB-dependent receptor [Paraglaciecola hydrolytica]KXI28416.1 TonB-dependent receptor [Paraglaciecola hydrolytica]
MKLHPLYLATLLAISAPVLAAQDSIENIVVTGSYSAVEKSQITSSSVIIDSETLLNLSSTSLVDALRQVPGLWVESQGGPGGLTSIVMRGAESNHTLVLVDGVQLNDPTNTRGGSFDLNNVNINSIKRIEIIRGAQSSIYGSDALAGVIHIITMEPSGKAEFNGFTTIGSDDYLTFGASASGTIDKLGYAIKAQKKDAGEPLKGSTAENTDLLAKLNWQGDEHELDLFYRYFDGNKTTYPEQSGGPEFAQSDELDSSDYRDQHAAASWAWQVTPLWLSKVTSTWFNRQDDSQSPGIVPYDAVPANGAKSDFTRTSAAWVNTLGEQKELWANVGLETKKENGDSDGYLNIGFLLPTNFSLSRTVNSAFVNVNGVLAEKLLLQASLRHDDPDGFSSNQSTSVGLRYALSNELNIFINRGEGFKLPSFFALGHPLVGNAELQPETSITLETGIEWQDSQLTASLNYFANEFRDLIDFDAELFTNVNRAKIDIKGLDGHLAWQSLNQQWQVSSQFNYSDIDSENLLNGRPKLTLGSSVNYVQNTSLSYNLQALWVDERYATSLHTGEAVQQALDSYLRFDANVRYTYDQHWQASLNLTNLTDADYQNDIGFAANGRAFYLNLIYSL